LGADLPETLAKKINEDTRAFIRSIATVRGRSVDALEATVTEARAYSATEAVELGVLDLLANDLADLLGQIEGRVVATASGDVTIHTDGSAIKHVDRTVLERFLGVVANPDLAFALMNLASVMLLIDVLFLGFSGLWIAALIAMGVASIGAGQLPVNWVGYGLFALAILLFYLELEDPGGGVFGVGGVVSFVIAGVLLFGGGVSPDIPEPSLRVSVWSLGVSAGIAASIVGAFFFLSRTTGSASDYLAGGPPTLVGKIGTVTSELGPSGHVRVGKVEWVATTDPGRFVGAGVKVRVVGEMKDVLKVRPDGVGWREDVAARRSWWRRLSRPFGP
jgi:membrane-bound serine protease (ClpP class)